MCMVSGRMELLPSFLRARLSAAAVISLSSPLLILSLVVTPMTRYECSTLVTYDNLSYGNMKCLYEDHDPKLITSKNCRSVIYIL